MSNSSIDKPRKIAVIGTVGLPAKYGGWETMVDQITINLKDDFEFLVYCSAAAYPDKVTRHNAASLKYIPLKANGLQSIPYDVISMIHAIRFVDVLLILGVSGCVFLPVLRLLSTKKIIVNIDGIEWKRGKWGRFAKWFLKLSEKIAVKYADVVITDNAEIARYVQSEYGVNSESIAYGGDHISKVPITSLASTFDLTEYGFLNTKYAFGVCRIEPENNVDIILETFSKNQHHHLVFVGNWDYSAYGKALKEQYSNCCNISLFEPIYDQNNLDLLRCNASLYVHGHSVGGTNPSLVEAMNLGLPVLAFDVSYNRETTENRAEYFSDVTELEALINTAENYTENAAAMVEIAQRRYRWQTISSQYKALINGLFANGGSK